MVGHQLPLQLLAAPVQEASMQGPGCRCRLQGCLQLQAAPARAWKPVRGCCSQLQPLLRAAAAVPEFGLLLG